ncbi:Fibroblast growth factor-binding protein 1 [Liparis tanakae]|uniref:Fibroblast growth factor-binding protein 1 n=1 Tax=Liparis tanakae TaxID=230148 RepID=A0A4Z2G5T8_9TELE|nr:Fibroblast growth factor-binding protein 1 [Liparis tanakae]
MSVMGRGELTRLRLLCRSAERSYWCDYVGRPHACSAYNKNLRHYFDGGKSDEDETSGSASDAKIQSAAVGGPRGEQRHEGGPELTSSSCQKSHGRRGRGADRGQHKVKLKPGLRPGRQSKAAAAPVLEGKMVTRDKYECTWAATGDDVFVLAVDCAKGRQSFGCEYVGRPASCPRYAADVKVYWKQIARALRRHKSLCRDGRASVKAAVCRRAPGDAHFRLLGARAKTSPPPVTPAAVRSCQPANRKLAEEHCSDAWSSFCTFLFTMVQDC